MGDEGRLDDIDRRADEAAEVATERSEHHDDALTALKEVAERQSLVIAEQNDGIAKLRRTIDDDRTVRRQLVWVFGIGLAGVLLILLGIGGLTLLVLDQSKSNSETLSIVHSATTPGEPIYERGQVNQGRAVAVIITEVDKNVCRRLERVFERDLDCPPDEEADDASPSPG